jgi:hypothetical protein
MKLNLTELLSIEICGSHGGAYEYVCLVGSDAVNFGLMQHFSFRLLISTFLYGATFKIGHR